MKVTAVRDYKAGTRRDNQGNVTKLEQPSSNVLYYELEDGGWFSREEVRLMLERSHPDGLFTPLPVAIAHALIRRLVDPGVPQEELTETAGLLLDLDVATGMLSWVSAGHLPPLLAVGDSRLDPSAGLAVALAARLIPL